MKKKIVLVDGSSYLFRAYHALPPLTNKKGHPTGAIFGVVKMIKNLYQIYQPDYFAVVFDAKGKTFRHEIYPQYKANRKKADDDLVVQINPLQAIIRALGYPLLIYPTVEADDVLGTLAKIANINNMETIISTGDKDLAQLVNANTSLINTMNQVKMDEAMVVEKFGVRADQIIDFLTLTGDTSDNIPGVEKVGPKTAIKWLNQYQTLDNIATHADEITGKVGDYLREFIRFQLDLSKKLVTIDCTVPLNHDVFDLTCAPANEPLLLDLYRTYGFNQWVDELSDGVSESTEDMSKATVGEYEIILNQATFDAWLERLRFAKLIAIDTETTSLDVMKAKLVGISFALEAGKAGYLPLQHSDQMDECVHKQVDYQSALESLRPILESNKIGKVGQNLKYDRSVFNQAGIALNGICEDTMLQSYVLNSVVSRHDLITLAQTHLNYKMISFADIAGKGKNQLTFDQIDIQTAGRYAAEDADICLRLYQHFQSKLAKVPTLQSLYRTIEVPLLSVLSKVEQNGVLIDGARLLHLSQTLGMQAAEVEQQAHELAGGPFNLASPKQIQEILYNRMQIPVLRKTPKGQPSTAEDVLQELSEDYELPKLILSHRSLSKLKSTYADALPKQINSNTGRVHTSYHQAVTSTGRLSSSAPNLQNIPIRTENGRKIRHAFIAQANHVLIAADYSQIELRIMAHLSEDPSLLNAFNQGWDIHSNTAAEVFDCSLAEVSQEQRRHAKAINFGLIYGMSAFGLAKQLRIIQADARKYIEMYFARYPKVKDYMEETKAKAKECGFVETLFGRRLYLPEINHKNAQRRQYAERTAINAPMQGTAADLIKMAMIKVDKELDKLDAMLIMQVHDELVIESPAVDQDPVKKIITNAMEKIAILKVPLLVDVKVALNWDDAH